MPRSLSFPFLTLVENRKIAALAIVYVIACIIYVFFVPESTAAALFGPRSVFVLPAAAFPHFSRRIGFQSRQGPVGIVRTDCNNGVSVICSNINRVLMPIPLVAYDINTNFGCQAPFGIETHRFKFHSGQGYRREVVDRRYSRGPESIVMSIYRTSFVAVQPRSVSSERKENR